MDVERLENIINDASDEYCFVADTGFFIPSTYIEENIHHDLIMLGNLADIAYYTHSLLKLGHINKGRFDFVMDLDDLDISKLSKVRKVFHENQLRAILMKKDENNIRELNKKSMSLFQILKKKLLNAQKAVFSLSEKYDILVQPSVIDEYFGEGRGILAYTNYEYMKKKEHTRKADISSPFKNLARYNTYLRKQILNYQLQIENIADMGFISIKEGGKVIEPYTQKKDIYGFLETASLSGVKCSDVDKEVAAQTLRIGLRRPVMALTADEHIVKLIEYMISNSNYPSHQNIVTLHLTKSEFASYYQPTSEMVKQHLLIIMKDYARNSKL